jgi:hypothetical protein
MIPCCFGAAASLKARTPSKIKEIRRLRRRLTG